MLSAIAGPCSYQYPFLFSALPVSSLALREAQVFDLIHVATESWLRFTSRCFPVSFQFSACFIPVPCLLSLLSSRAKPLLPRQCIYRLKCFWSLFVLCLPAPTGMATQKVWNAKIKKIPKNNQYEICVKSQWLLRFLIILLMSDVTDYFILPVLGRTSLIMIES